MIHLKYKCKVNVLKLPLIWFDMCLKLVFENATSRPQHRLPLGCELREKVAKIMLTTQKISRQVEYITRQLVPWDAVHTRACTGIKNAYNSVTVQNRTHVYMNFFDHKDLGNHLLQYCPQVVKHPVYTCTVRSKSSECLGRYVNTCKQADIGAYRTARSKGQITRSFFPSTCKANRLTEFICAWRRYRPLSVAHCVAPSWNLNKLWTWEQCELTVWEIHSTARVPYTGAGGGTQFPSARCPRILNFVRHGLIFVGLHYVICFTSPFLRLTFYSDP